jgi:CubicO group peptidase (beta-lactamase class C family)
MRAVGVELLLAASLMWSTACAPAAKAPPRVAPAAKPVCAASNDQLVEAIRAVHDKQRNIGVQTAIHLDGRLVFSSGIGLADRERKIPVTRSTVFPVASVTKAFTGVATLKPTLPAR